MSEFVERFSLNGKTALVTGASKGIGFEICRVLADAEADIVAVARDKAGLAEAEAEVTAKGRQCLVVEADMADVGQVQAAAKSACDHFGMVDILVNNAGVALLGDLAEATVEDWDKTMAVNLRAPFILAQALVGKMIDKGAGKIINISSQAGVIGLQAHGAYCSSKGGLNMLTQVMCAEWSKHNIQCNAVCPNIILTPMGEQVWGEEEKARPMRERTPLGPFWQTGRGLLTLCCFLRPMRRTLLPVIRS